MNRNQIVGTMGISQAIENLISDSCKFLIFVSPYLKITERLKAKLIDALSQVDDCYFIYRENELRKDEERWIKSFKNVHLIGVNNLHAKIYLNEKHCVLTSMNFYEYSQINNYEIGVVMELIVRENTVQDVLNEILLYTRLSNKYHKITKTLEPYLDYTMRSLFKELQKNNKYKYMNYNDEGYKQFCNDARKLVKFTDEEYYLDKTAILRSSNIGKKRYDIIFNKLK